MEHNSNRISACQWGRLITSVFRTDPWWTYRSSRVLRKNLKTSFAVHFGLPCLYVLSAVSQDTQMARFTTSLNFVTFTAKLVNYGCNFHPLPLAIKECSCTPNVISWHLPVRHWSRWLSDSAKDPFWMVSLATAGYVSMSDNIICSPIELGWTSKFCHL